VFEQQRGKILFNLRGDEKAVFAGTNEPEVLKRINDDFLNFGCWGLRKKPDSIRCN
jgi:hypothetical protein